MTMVQHNLLEEAKDMWRRGFAAPTRLLARMAQQGMDIIKLEAIYRKA